MKHLPVTLLPGQLANLLKLSDYLLSRNLKADFDMDTFTDAQPDPITGVASALKATCGTVGCAAGHGPYAGILKLTTESWVGYTRRVFMERTDEKDFSAAWDFCFSGRWVEYDNTPEGAGRRIKYMLDNGVPVTGYTTIDYTIKY